MKIPLCVFLKYVLKTGASMRYVWLTEYAPVRPCSLLSFSDRLQNSLY